MNSIRQIQIISQQARILGKQEGLMAGIKAIGDSNQRVKDALIDEYQKTVTEYEDLDREYKELTRPAELEPAGEVQTA